MSGGAKSGIISPMKGRTTLALLMMGFSIISVGAAGSGHDPASWQGDLAPLPESAWNAGRAAHLLERAGFGGTPTEYPQAL